MTRLKTAMMAARRGTESNEGEVPDIRLGSGKAGVGDQRKCLAGERQCWADRTVCVT